MGEVIPFKEWERRSKKYDKDSLFYVFLLDRCYIYIYICIYI